MNTGQFWKLIADARARAADAADSEAVAAQATILLSAFPPPEIVANEPVLQGLMAASYRTLLWAAASLINGGCSDDGFDYFRGWLIGQGREVFGRTVADPDSLADLPVIGPPRIGKPPIECEDTLYIVMRAHKTATGQEIPADAFTIRYPELEEAIWHFAGRSELARRLPRLTSLCWPDVTDGDTNGLDQVRRRSPHPVPGRRAQPAAMAYLMPRHAPECGRHETCNPTH